MKVIKAVFDNGREVLWPGAFVNVRLAVATFKGAVAVPQAAVIRGPRGVIFYVVDDAGKAAGARPLQRQGAGDDTRRGGGFGECARARRLRGMSRARVARPERTGRARRLPRQAASAASSVQLGSARRGVHHRDGRGADTACLGLFIGRIAHVPHREIEPQRDAGERMVAVEHDVLGIDLGHGIDRVGRKIRRDRTGRRAVELHADPDGFGQRLARFEEDQLRVEFPERVLRLEVQDRREARLFTGQCFLDLFEQIVAAVKKLYRIGQLVDRLALGVLQFPGQADDAGRTDSHRIMIAQSIMNTLPDVALPSPLLGGLSPRKFMRRHWQKKPLLVRQAMPGGIDLISRQRLFALAGQDEIESRLVVRDGQRWSLRQGPFKRSALPPLGRPGWTLLVQGLDLHLPAARALLDRFRFLPDARLDDLMLSYASDGGGVGPHVDSYDVFLLQATGRRRWRIGRAAAGELLADAPLKVLAHFEPEHDWLLEPGDMLYLPPGWAHDGSAEGECTTCSIGFRAAGRDEIARDVMQRHLDAANADLAGPLYRDPAQTASTEPGRIPEALQRFAIDAVRRLASDRYALACALGEWLSEPKRGVWFDPAPSVDSAAAKSTALVLDRRTRMLYDRGHVFINGESFRAAGRDARILQGLANRRGLSAEERARLGAPARALLDEWIAAGWLRTDALRDGHGS